MWRKWFRSVLMLIDGIVNQENISLSQDGIDIEDDDADGEEA